LAFHIVASENGKGNQPVKDIVILELPDTESPKEIAVGDTRFKCDLMDRVAFQKHLEAYMTLERGTILRDSYIAGTARGSSGTRELAWILVSESIEKTEKELSTAEMNRPSQSDIPRMANIEKAVVSRSNDQARQRVEPQLGATPRTLFLEWSGNSPIIKFTPQLKNISFQRNEALMLVVFLTPANGQSLDGRIAGAAWEGHLLIQSDAVLHYGAVTAQNRTLGYRWRAVNFEGNSQIAHGKTISIILEGAPSGAGIDWQSFGSQATVTVAVCTYRNVNGSPVFQRFVTPIEWIRFDCK
jgi:hypothetical protein